MPPSPLLNIPSRLLARVMPESSSISSIDDTDTLSSTSIHDTKTTANLSTGASVGIVVVFLLFLFTLGLISCLCFRRSRARRLAKLEAEENKALPPKINGVNAKFYGPGIGVEEVETGSFVDEEKEEVKQPEKVWIRWQDALRGQVKGGIRHV